MRDDLNKDLNKILVIGNYMIKIWRAIGMNEKVEFLWSSTESNKCADKYWRTVLDVAHKNMVAKMTCDPHSKQDHLTGVAQIFCLCMQCADILFPEADICQLGMDHHKVNVFAREYCDGINRKDKPVILSHDKLPDLQNGKAKIDPLSSIFTKREVYKKINNAYCPEKTVEGNPCLEYIKYIILPWFQEFKVERRVEHGGEKTFKSFEELVADYETGHLHPKDLKSVLSKALNKILQPVRDHFERDAKAKDLLKLIKANKIPQFVEEQSVSINSQDQPASSTSSTSTSHMSLEERFLIMMSAGEECLKEEELWELLTRKPEPICFDGFEPLGRMHIAQGVMKTIVVNKLATAGCKVKIWIADWFAILNNKMGGDLKKIEVVGKYMIEVWRAIGMNHITDKVEFLWSSTEINRCVQIMGRSEKDDLTAAQIFYPVMQCAHIFFLEADICQLGMDQCKLNVLAREYCGDIKRKNKPIILSHHMLPGLLKGQEKMSKSDPLSSIFIEDEETEVNKKINNAYCPEKTVEGNPCVEYIKYIIFPWFNEFKVERRVDHGGEKTFESFEELVADYETGHLHPEDLKSALSKALNQM